MSADTAPTQSRMSPEWQKSEAAGLRASAARLTTGTHYESSVARAMVLQAQADRLERAYLEEGECLEDGRGPLTAEERAAMDAVRVGGLPG